MSIAQVQTLILHAPVTHNLIGDSTHRISHWGMPGVRPVVVRDGVYRAPELPGAGTTLKPEALEQFGVR